MELPKINSLRNKNIIINSKKILLKPWTNLQLVNFESSKDDELKIDIILRELIEPNIECNQKLTLVEERIVLIELYKLSKSNIIDIIFTCEKCETPSEHSIFLDKVINFKELNTRTIKTKDCIFNLRHYSLYRIDLNKDINEETMTYVASFIDSIDYNDEIYEGFELQELKDWLINELDKDNFNTLIKKFDEIQPRIEITAEAICEHCGTKQEINFKGVENFLE